jgi:hypothetical protein
VPEPARQELTEDDPPISDPEAIERAYHLHRAKRRAKVEHERRAKHASVRFWVVLWLLLFASVVLALTIWDQMQQLFGL